MSGHAVVRHPEVGLGVASYEAMDEMRARGWTRVSDYVSNPVLLNVADYADAPDLDAPAPSTPAEPDDPENEE